MRIVRMMKKIRIGKSNARMQASYSLGFLENQFQISDILTSAAHPFVKLKV